jgi:PAS domain S-box-containing protein
MAGERILVVEDEGIVAMEIRDRLTTLGYEVVATVSTGDAAIKKTAQLLPDLILMDIVLKGPMDGTEATEHIRKHHEIPIVYMTAHADYPTLERAKHTQPFGYIIKPFSERDLYTTIEMALYKHRIDGKIKTSEHWLMTTLKSIGEAVITIDTDERITFMNPAAEFLTGWKATDAAGQDAADVFNIIKEELPMLTGNPVLRVVREGVLITKDGQELPVDYNAAPILDDDTREITGVVLIFRDKNQSRHDTIIGDMRAEL